MNNMEYTVVQERLCEALIRAVNRMIEDGWEPQGGITMDSYPAERLWVQAMIRRPAAFSTKKVSPKELSISSASAGVAQIDINAGSPPVH